jgi:hypothetical protein
VAEESDLAVRAWEMAGESDDIADGVNEGAVARVVVCEAAEEGLRVAAVAGEIEGDGDVAVAGEGDGEGEHELLGAGEAVGDDDRGGGFAACGGKECDRGCTDGRVGDGEAVGGGGELPESDGDAEDRGGGDELRQGLCLL